MFKFLSMEISSDDFLKRVPWVSLFYSHWNKREDKEGSGFPRYLHFCAQKHFGSVSLTWVSDAPQTHTF